MLKCGGTVLHGATRKEAVDAVSRTILGESN